MRTERLLVVAAALALVAAVPQPLGNPDLGAIADKLTKQMALRPGETVLLIAHAGRFDNLVTLLRSRITAAGAIDLGAISVGGGEPAGWDSAFARQSRGKSAEELRGLFATVDLAVMLPGTAPTHRPYAVMQEVLRRGHGRTIHFHWSGAFNMLGEPLPDSAIIDALYERALLETDYRELAAVQRRLEAAMRSDVVHVSTPLGTNLRFQIGDRPVTRQDGDASADRLQEARVLIDREIELPAGAIRVAPVETTVHGTIAFPDSIWHGELVQGLVVTFEAGRIIEFDAAIGRNAVLDELREAGNAARSFREFALGLNPLLAVPEGASPWIPYFGYGAGVVRLSLGDNSELGGKVTGGYVRWNFFTDATVRIGDTVWVRDGRLIPDP